MSSAGTLNLVMQTPIGERKATLNLQSSGGALTGKMTAEGGSIDIRDGKVAGNAASWKADIKNPMPLTLEFSGTVDGDKISGTVNAAVGSWPVSGSRGAYPSQATPTSRTPLRCHAGTRSRHPANRRLWRSLALDPGNTGQASAGTTRELMQRRGPPLRWRITPPAAVRQ